MAIAEFLVEDALACAIARSGRIARRDQFGMRLIGGRLGAHLGIGLRAPPAGARIVAAAREVLRETALAVILVARSRHRALRHLDMVLGQFVHEARGNGALPQRMDAAVGGEGNESALLCPRDADIGETALFLEARTAALIERALVREQALFPAGQKHGFKFQPLGRLCSVMMLILSAVSFCSNSMTSEICSR